MKLSEKSEKNKGGENSLTVYEAELIDENNQSVKSEVEHRKNPVLLASTLGKIAAFAGAFLTSMMNASKTSDINKTGRNSQGSKGGKKCRGKGRRYGSRP